MNNQFTAIMRRTRRWKFEGGTTELMLGGIFLCGALYFLLQLIPSIPPALIFLVFLFLLIGTLIVPAVLQRRLVYPRSGYVQYKETSPRGIWKPLLLAAGAGVLMAIFFTLVLVYDHSHAIAWVTAILGLFLGLIWIIGDFTFKIHRLTFLDIFSILLGLLVSPVVLGTGPTRGDELGGILLGAYFPVIGIAFFITGGLTLRKFLRDNPLPAEAPDER
jgi:xanthosine utilization system XapX-like protein